jgi:hypothetical protein
MLNFLRVLLSIIGSGVEDCSFLAETVSFLHCQEKNVMQPEKKYFKRGDLAAIQQQEYMQKYGSKAEEIVTEKERIREEKVEEKKRGKRIIRKRMHY